MEFKDGTVMGSISYGYYEGEMKQVLIIGAGQAETMLARNIIRNHIKEFECPASSKVTISNIILILYQELQNVYLIQLQ